MMGKAAIQHAAYGKSRIWQGISRLHSSVRHVFLPGQEKSHTGQGFSCCLILAHSASPHHTV